MNLRQSLLILHAFGLIGLTVPFALGYTYTDRLSTRQALYSVTVTDQIHGTAIGRRPRKAAVVVVDGLGYKEALGMRVTHLLRQRGQCRKTAVGSLPMSRPVYGVLSTGVEQDRGGPLSNDATAPHAAQSVWELARAAGFSVAAVSELYWWKELFPRGFGTYLMPPRSANYFRLAPPADLALIHPLYVDETGHKDGADSDAYRAAVARADDELLGFLDTLDLKQDLIIFTADHGHSLGGGHGGAQDRVAHVLTCFAGIGVQKEFEIGTLRMTSLGPALSLLLGIPFPSGMRAGDDDLDNLWTIADPNQLPASYLSERRLAVEYFRIANRAQLAAWLPQSAGSWTAFYATTGRYRLVLAIPMLLLAGLLMALHFHSHTRHGDQERTLNGFLFGLLWTVGCLAAAYGLQVELRGSFDMSSINNRHGFIRFTAGLGLMIGLSGLGLHLLLRHSLRALIWDLTLLSGIGTLLCSMHPMLYGWHLDFPVPSPPVYFFPYFAALFFATLNSLALLLGTILWTNREWHDFTAPMDKTPQSN